MMPNHYFFLLAIGMCLHSTFSLLGQIDPWLSPGSKYYYQACYLNEHGDTLSSEEISIQITDERWEWDSAQIKVIFDYLGTIDNKSAFEPAIDGVDLIWESQEITGIKAFSYMVFMHPFRSKQYYLTEIAPFPKFVRTAIGAKWKSALFIGEGWGEFTGKSKRVYKASALEDYKTDRLHITSCTKVNAFSRHRLGKSSLDYLYHSNYGFVQMNYIFFNGHQLLIHLIHAEHDLDSKANQMSPSTDKVIDWIQALGGSFIRIHPIDLIKKHHIDLRIDKGETNILRNYNTDMKEINAVWYRRWSVGSYINTSYNTEVIKDNSTHDIEAHLYAEFRTISGYFLNLFGHCNWLSEVRSVNKLKVLRAAVNAGLKVPETLITNHKESVVAFHKQQHGQVITKCISESVDVSTQSEEMDLIHQ